VTVEDYASQTYTMVAWIWITVNKYYIRVLVTNEGTRAQARDHNWAERNGKEKMR
jgi:hypothetical protein